MKRRIISILFCSFFFTCAFAQLRSEEPEEYGMRKQRQSIQYCLSYSDYQKDVWHEVDDVKVAIRKADKKALMARLDYYFTSRSDKRITKVLRDSAFAIRIGGKYYVHAKFLQYGGHWMFFKRDYVRAYPMQGHRLLFVSRYLSLKYGYGNFGGPIWDSGDVYTAPIVAESTGTYISQEEFYRRGGYSRAVECPYLVCYYVDDGSSYVKIVDGDNFRPLVAGHTDVIDIYNETCGTTYFQKADVFTVLPLLMKAGALLRQP